MHAEDSIAFFPAPVAELGVEVGKAVAQDLLTTLPEVLRRARLGAYMNDVQAQAETGLSAPAALPPRTAGGAL